MPIPDKVEIKHPTGHNTAQKAVPLRFAVAGTAKGDLVKNVRGTVRKHGSTQNIPGNRLFFITKQGPGSSKYRWLLLFTVLQGGMYRVDVEAVDATGTVVLDRDEVEEFEVTGGEGEPFVQLDYPPDNHVITGPEVDYFVAYGNHSHPVLVATIDGISAEFICDDLTIPFWSAHFPSLAALSGAQTLEVIDSENHNDTRNVSVT